jgi:hypothetical protein
MEMNTSFSSGKQSQYPTSHSEKFLEISPSQDHTNSTLPKDWHLEVQIHPNLFEEGDMQHEPSSFSQASNLDSKIFLDRTEEIKSPKSSIFSSSGESLSPPFINQRAQIYHALRNPYLSFGQDLKFGCNMSEEEIPEPSMETLHHQNSILNEHSNSAKTGGRTKVRRKAWQDQEDELLLELVEKYGKKWSKIASIMKGRTGKQIRDRYLNNLNPEIVDKDWTPEEDNLILFLYYNWGKKWSKVAAALPGRSEGQVKNRFYWGLKRKVLNCQFTNCDPIHLLTHHSDEQLSLNSLLQDKSPIPRISLQPMTSLIDQKVYWDYPTSLLKNNEKDSTPALQKQTSSNPDDFISYSTPPDERLELNRLLNNYPPN